MNERDIVRDRHADREHEGRIGEGGGEAQR